MTQILRDKATFAATVRLDVKTGDASVKKITYYATQSVMTILLAKIRKNNVYFILGEILYFYCGVMKKSE